MRQRPAARIFLIDKQNRVLLFHFVFSEGALAGFEFWATPGGEVNPGETFEEAAKRELFEETGIEIESVGEQVAERVFEMKMPDGEMVHALEKFYLLRTEISDPNRLHQTEEESRVIVHHKWWRIEELRDTSENVFPKGIAEILEPLIS